MPKIVFISGGSRPNNLTARALAVVDEDVERALRGVVGSLVEFMKDYVIRKLTLEVLVREDATPWPAEI